VISPNLTFQVYGTQLWGIQNFNNYPGDGSWRFYQIPVGQFYTGDAAYLFFTADHDVGTRDGNSFFRGVTVSEGAPCASNAALPQSLQEPATETMRLLPNPANEQVSVVLEQVLPGATFTVMDLAGRTLLSGDLVGDRTTITTSGLPAGTYLLRCGNDAESHTRRFTVVH